MNTRFGSNRPPGKPVSLNQTPPPPQNQHTGRHASHTYMVEPPLAIPRTGRSPVSYPVNSERTRTFTRNTSNVVQQQTQQPVQARGIVRLDQERTGPRAKNEYVDTPKSGNSQNQSSHVLIDTICSQPTSLKKPDQNRTLVKNVHEDSIICPNCHKCKCQKCRATKELPRTWINKNYECSAQKCVEVCSCLCCVQCIFQTVFNDSEDEDCVADDPCACCSQRHCCKRWMLMGVLSLCLPGLLCYPILKGGLLVCNKCYNGLNNNGCKCKKESGIKKLLLDPENSSTTTT